MFWKCYLCKLYKNHKCLRNISVSLRKLAEEQNIKLLLNEKICGTCYKKINNKDTVSVNDTCDVPGPSGVKRNINRISSQGIILYLIH